MDMGFLNLTNEEVAELMDYAASSEKSVQRTEKVARLGRWLFWPEIAIRHSEGYANALPDEFWELTYDKSADVSAIKLLLEMRKSASK